MDDFKLDIEVKVTVKPVSPKVGTAKRGPYERNLFVVRESKKVHYVGAKSDVAGFVAAAVNVASQEFLEGLEMPKILSVNPLDTLVATAVNLNATGDNIGLSTVPTAEYGVTSALGSSQASTVTPDVSNESTDTDYVFAVTGLTEKTQYYYRIKMVSATGTVYSELRTFTTPAA